MANIEPGNSWAQADSTADKTDKRAQRAQRKEQREARYAPHLAEYEAALRKELGERLKPLDDAGGIALYLAAEAPKGSEEQRVMADIFVELSAKKTHTVAHLINSIVEAALCTRKFNLGFSNISRQQAQSLQDVTSAEGLAPYIGRNDELRGPRPEQRNTFRWKAYHEQGEVVDGYCAIAVARLSGLVAEALRAAAQAVALPAERQAARG